MAVRPAVSRRCYWSAAHPMMRWTAVSIKHASSAYGTIIDKNYLFNRQKEKIYVCRPIDLTLSVMLENDLKDGKTFELMILYILYQNLDAKPIYIYIYNGMPTTSVPNPHRDFSSSVGIPCAIKVLWQYLTILYFTFFKFFTNKPKPKKINYN